MTDSSAILNPQQLLAGQLLEHLHDAARTAASWDVSAPAQHRQHFPSAGARRSKSTQTVRNELGLGFPSRYGSRRRLPTSQSSALLELRENFRLLAIWPLPACPIALGSWPNCRASSAMRNKTNPVLPPRPRSTSAPSMEIFRHRPLAHSLTNCRRTKLSLWENCGASQASLSSRCSNRCWPKHALCCALIRRRSAASDLSSPQEPALHQPCRLGLPH
jgi:hypothetical protein